MISSKHLNRFSRKNLLLLFWMAGVTFFIGIFAMFTDQIYEHDELDTVDRAIFLFVNKLRAPALNNIAVDLTALGSPTVIALTTVMGILLLWLKRDRTGAIYVGLTSAGSGFWTFVIKRFVGRDRPLVIPRIVEVSGQSYPSGHSFAAASLYLGLMFLTFNSFKSVRNRIILFCSTVALICMVSLSRIYLGVHYPSDVVAGVSLGFAWTLFLTGIFYWWKECD